MLWTSELQVVVLAGGRGSRMTDLIGNSVPKCLIPFGGNPLLFYPLKSLANSGFAGREVLVIIQDRDDIRRTVLTIGEQVGLSIDTFGVPEESEDFGTAESLRLAILAKKITRDVLIMSCDVVGQLPIRKLLDLHGLRDSSFTSVYMNSLPPPTSTLPGPRSKYVVERDIVGVTEPGGELVFMASEADLDEDLVLPTPSLKKFPNFKLLTWLTDAHLYIIKKSLLDRLFVRMDDGDKHLSLKGEFLPWIVAQSALPSESFSCHTLVEKESNCLRINSVHNFSLMFQSLNWLKETFPGSIEGPEETKIGRGSKLVGVTLGDHCTVGEKARLNNVITLDHVMIEGGVELSNVIVSSNAQIGEGATLKDCMVGPKYQVQAGARHTNEHLTVVEETFFEP